jgi:hypothetical protein
VDRLRSTLAAPGAARSVGVLVALAGVALLIGGVVALGQSDPGSSGAAPAPVGPSVSARPSPTRPSATASTPGSTAAPTASRRAPSTAPRPTTVAPPQPSAPARAPLTVLNNSTIRGLADRAATEVQGRGWQVAQVANFAGRLATTTVYYTPGDAAGQAAATELAREFPQIDQVLPRYAGLPPTPAGIVLVVTKDW